MEKENKPTNRRQTKDNFNHLKLLVANTDNTNAPREGKQMRILRTRHVWRRVCFINIISVSLFNLSLTWLEFQATLDFLYHAIS